MALMYKLSGNYEDLSEQTGTINVQLQLMLTNEIFLEGNNGNRIFKGFFTEVKDTKVRDLYGQSQIQLLELTHPNSLSTNILWHAYCDSPFTEGEFRGERIESLDRVFFNNEYLMFNRNFIKAELRGVSLPLRFTFYRK